MEQADDRRTRTVKEFLLVFVLYFGAFSGLGRDFLWYAVAALVAALLVHATRYAKEPYCYVLRTLILVLALVIINVNIPVAPVPANAALVGIAIFTGYLGFRSKILAENKLTPRSSGDRP